MGADIHAFLELEWKRDDGTQYITSMSEIYLGRDYELFGLLAGVRGCGPVFPVRGIPENLGWDTEERFYVKPLSVLDLTEEQQQVIYDTFGCFNGYAPDSKIKEWNLKPAPNRKDVFLAPDYHSHSYLYFKELHKIHKIYRTECSKEGNSNFTAFLMYMWALTKEYKRTAKPRLVFCFDS